MTDSQHVSRSYIIVCSLLKSVSRAFSEALLKYFGSISASVQDEPPPPQYYVQYVYISVDNLYCTEQNFVNCLLYPVVIDVVKQMDSLRCDFKKSYIQGYVLLRDSISSMSDIKRRLFVKNVLLCLCVLERGTWSGSYL